MLFFCFFKEFAFGEEVVNVVAEFSEDERAREGERVFSVFKRVFLRLQRSFDCASCNPNAKGHVVLAGYETKKECACLDLFFFEVFEEAEARAVVAADRVVRVSFSSSIGFSVGCGVEFLIWMREVVGHYAFEEFVAP